MRKTATPASPTTTPEGAYGGQTVTTPGGITFAYGGSYGLAVTEDQVLTKAYIPPCDPGFDYCLYRTGEAYANTNFESAGLRIEERKDLTTESACLSTPPAGYADFTPTIQTHSDYSTSVFSPLGDAGAGHYAQGALYRLYFGTTCYEFETRIGQTQFANYPPGAIQEFTKDDLAAVSAELAGMLDSVTIAATGERVAFPETP
ncbi:hypothetical protein KGQ55_00570 [Patescibacteria group bacterium]|nr:hypothetical protein [Patescibacteria group bacterium]